MVNIVSGCMTSDFLLTRKHIWFFYLFKRTFLGQYVLRKNIGFTDFVDGMMTKTQIENFHISVRLPN